MWKEGEEFGVLVDVQGDALEGVRTLASYHQILEVCKVAFHVFVKVG